MPIATEAPRMTPPPHRHKHAHPPSVFPHPAAMDLPRHNASAGHITTAFHQFEQPG